MDVDDGTASQRKTGDANIRRLEDGGMHAFRFSIFGCRRRFPSSKLCNWVIMVIVWGSYVNLWKG